MRLIRFTALAVAVCLVMALGFTALAQDSECEDEFVDEITELLEDRDWEGIVAAASEALAACTLSQDGVLYRITINAGTNIRDLAGIPSDIVGKAAQGVE